MTEQTEPVRTPYAWKPLTPEQKAERRAARQARLASQKVREAAKADLAQQIQGKFCEGLSSDQIGETLGISPRRVRRYLAKSTMSSLKPHQRFLGFRCSAKTARIVHRLAEGAQVSAPEMVDRILRSVTSDGLAYASRRLGKLALPKQPRGRPRKAST